MSPILPLGSTAESLRAAGHNVVEYHFYNPPGVQRVLACETSAFIGEVDEFTIMKYPMSPGGDMTRLKIEHEILTVVGQHPYIIAHKRLTETGLYLERATNGTIHEFLTSSDQTAPTIQQRVTWRRELAEVVEHVHSKRVTHCDIQPTNVLVDRDLHIKLSDFQGRHLSKDGEVIFDGWNAEPCRYWCPRDDLSGDVKTDLFALGSTIYFVMTGHEVFPDILSGEAGWHDQVSSRFKNGVFPEDSHACASITQKCLRQQYASASEALKEIRAVEQDVIRKV